MILRFFKWLVHKLGVKSLIGFSLLGMAVGSAAFALSGAIRQIGFDMVLPILLISLVLSWLIASTKIQGSLAVPLLMIFGWAAALIQVGELSNPILALIRTLFSSLWQVLNLDPQDAIHLPNLYLAYIEVSSGVNRVIGALVEWLQSLRDGLPLINDIAVAMLWCNLLFLVASWAGWWFRRTWNPLLALLPAGIVSMTILSYTWSGTIVLAPMVFSVLLLFAFVNYDRSEEGWKSARMDYPEDLYEEFSTIVFSGITVLVILAFILPSISFRSLVDFVSRFTMPQIEQAEPFIQSFGLEQSSIPRGDMSSAVRGGLPRMHLINSGPELEKEIVMTVKVSGGLPENRENFLLLPLYWRSLTYNEYFGAGWRSSEIIIRTYQSGEEVISADSPNHYIVEQDYRMAQGETRFLFSVGEILTADDDFKIAFRPTLRYTEIFDAHGDFFGASIDQNSYRVRSLLPIVSDDILRQAGDQYPEWVTKYYLSLPDTIPSRVHKLAGELTSSDQTAYEKVQSLENYLRGYTYALDIDLPPPRRDLVDYFLFDRQEGYCDYFASAMAVMARSLGIPARLAIGYTRGVYDQTNDRYVVSEANAHSWVEVYFPGIGWVPFEPTAGRESISWFDSGAEIIQPGENQPNLDDLKSWQKRIGIKWNWSSSLIFTLCLSLLIGWGFYLFDHIRLNKMHPLDATNHLFQRLYRAGRGLGIHSRIDDTPNEFTDRLIKHLNTLAESAMFEESLRNTVTLVQELTKYYTRMRYSLGNTILVDQRSVIRIWKDLRRYFWLARLRQFNMNSIMPLKQIINLKIKKK
jgi:hypothetical protein